MSQLFNTTDHCNVTADLFGCEAPKEGMIFWTSISAISFIFGFPGVVAILLEMIQRGRKGTPFTPNEVFMVNLTVMDGIFLIIIQTETLLSESNVVYQAFVYFVYSFVYCGRPLFITCTCLDCYVAVVHPVTYRARKSLTPRVLMAVGVWSVTVVYGCFMVTRSLLYFVNDHVLSDIIPILCLILTLPTVGFCDFAIFWTLMRSNPGGRNIHPQKKKALQIIINNIVITCISYLPLIITLLVSIFLTKDRKIIDCLVMLPVLAATLLGNTFSIILHLNNLGKLEWLKCWKLK